jgi:NTP pyrophosphatase (non-canonical NTP hydrolase)
MNNKLNERTPKEQPQSQVPDDFEKITGHKTPEEMAAYEKGREHEEAVFMKFIKEWDGKTNSHFGQAMYDTFERLNKSQVSDEDVGLTFNALRNANKLRLPQFKNSKGEPAHEKADGSDWSLAEWMNAVAGELGEAANIIKKIRRGDMTLIEAKEMLAEEFADIVTYLDITSYQAGINLGEATKNKFNKVSERVGSNIRLDKAALQYRPQSQVSDEEIENMAKKEYPDDKCFIDRKVGFIRGFKAALQHNQQPNESNRKS